MPVPHSQDPAQDNLDRSTIHQQDQPLFPELAGVEVESKSLTDEDVQKALSFLISARPSLSYNTSYCGEPPGLLKSFIAELERKGAKAL